MCCGITQKIKIIKLRIHSCDNDENSYDDTSKKIYSGMATPKHQSIGENNKTVFDLDTETNLRVACLQFSPFDIYV